MPSGDHPVYSNVRKNCECCGKLIKGQVVHPVLEGAKAVVLFMCPRCDRTR